MMRERRQLVDMWQRGEAAALATLIHVEGSSYRKVGARLMVSRSGDYVGSISGGCLEAEVVQKMQWLVRKGACTQRYSTLFDDTADIPYGLGCGGTIDLLLEPAGTAEFELLMEALRSSLQGNSCDLATSLPSEGRPMARSIVQMAETPNPHLTRMFQERLLPPQRFFVIGAGDDAQPMVSMAALLGWRVFVLDGRAQWAKSERFPAAEQVFVRASSAEEVSFAADDVVVLMTHSYEQDRDWLKALLPAAPRYLGLLGARHRSALLASEVASLLQLPLEQVCEHLSAPVGLDLGGDGAEAIALSVIAEIQACIEGRQISSRRMTAEIIQEQIAIAGASRYLQAQCAM